MDLAFALAPFVCLLPGAALRDGPRLCCAPHLFRFGRRAAPPGGLDIKHRAVLEAPVAHLS